MKLTMTFEVKETMEERKLEIPTRWLSRIDPHPDRPTVNTWLSWRAELAEPEKGRYDFDAQVAYDKEMLHKFPLEELDSAWKELRVMILDVEKDMNAWKSNKVHQLSGVIEDVSIPDELRVIIKKIEKEGPHRVTAPDAYFCLLASILYPVGELIADGALREYELNEYCAMLRGHFVEGYEPPKSDE